MKRNAKTKEAKGSKQPKTPKLLKEPKPRIPRKPAAKQKTQTGNVLTKSKSAGTKRKKNDQGEKDDNNVKNKERYCPDGGRDDQSGPNIRAKEEVRLMTIIIIVL